MLHFGAHVGNVDASGAAPNEPPWLSTSRSLDKRHDNSLRHDLLQPPLPPHGSNNLLAGRLPSTWVIPWTSLRLTTRPRTAGARGAAATRALGGNRPLPSISPRLDRSRGSSHARSTPPTSRSGRSRPTAGSDGTPSGSTSRIFSAASTLVSKRSPRTSGPSPLDPSPSDACT